MTLRLMLLLFSLAVCAGLYLQGTRAARRRAAHGHVPDRGAPTMYPTRPAAGETRFRGADAGLERLYVKALSPRGFQGIDIRNALEDADMESGEMGIFHYYGDGPRGRCALVSAANMYEPGTLAADTLDHIETRGLVLFVPPGGGTRAQLAQCAQAVAAGLSAAVFDADMRRLDRDALEHMREDDRPEET